MINKDTGTGLAIGFLIGAVVGLAIGYLYAPHPEAETRQLIKEKTEKVMDKATGVIDKVQESTAKARYKKRWIEQKGG